MPTKQNSYGGAVLRNKLINTGEFMKHLKDGMTIMIGGFMGNGTPEALVDAIIESGIKDYTVIANDTAMPGVGISKLIATKRVKKLIASHIGLNPQTGELMGTGELDVTLVPQGTLIERIRCGGSGIGGFLTPTGLGTDVENGKQIVAADGKNYLLELPLKADLAIIRGTTVDKSGNVFFAGTTKNFNPLIATAADTVVAEAETLVESGELETELVMLSGIFVDFIVGGAN